MLPNFHSLGASNKSVDIYINSCGIESKWYYNYSSVVTFLVVNKKVNYGQECPLQCLLGHFLENHTAQFCL